MPLLHGFLKDRRIQMKRAQLDTLGCHCASPFPFSFLPPSFILLVYTHAWRFLHVVEGTLQSMLSDSSDAQSILDNAHRYNLECSLFCPCAHCGSHLWGKSLQVPRALPEACSSGSLRMVNIVLRAGWLFMFLPISLQEPIFQAQRWKVLGIVGGKATVQV